MRSRRPNSRNCLRSQARFVHARHRAHLRMRNDRGQWDLGQGGEVLCIDVHGEWSSMCRLGRFRGGRWNTFAGFLLAPPEGAGEASNLCT